MHFQSALRPLCWQCKYWNYLLSSGYSDRDSGQTSIIQLFGGIALERTKLQVICGIHSWVEFKVFFLIIIITCIRPQNGRLACQHCRDVTISVWINFVCIEQSEQVWDQHRYKTNTLTCIPRITLASCTPITAAGCLCLIHPKCQNVCLSVCFQLGYQLSWWRLLIAC